MVEKKTKKKTREKPAYSFQLDVDDKKISKAYGKNLNVSWKDSNEVCYAVKGMFVDKALVYLEKVQNKEDFIPFRRYKRHRAHRKGGKPGGYPIKAAKFVSKVLRNAQANAEQKGLDVEKLKIKHATAMKSITLERIRPKGRGGSSWPYSRGMMANIDLTNIEIILQEV